MENIAADTHLPNFSTIQAHNIVNQLKASIESNQKKLKKLISKKSLSAKKFIYELDNLEDEINKIWSPFSHLNAVKNSEETRNAYNVGLKLLTDYHTQLQQNQELYKKALAIRDSAEWSQLNFAEQKIIQDMLRDFRLSGVTLSEQDRKKYAEIQLKLADLKDHFSRNILDASNQWHYQILDEKKLSGLPEHTIQLAKQNALDKKQEGWIFNLDYPTYHDVLTYADDPSLREIFYKAYVTRASELGDAKYDNTELMNQILKLRLELAKLVGFNNFAEYSLATKMAKTPDEVVKFLTDLANKIKPRAQKEFEQLEKFAKTKYKVKKLEAWDIAYYSEKLQQKLFSISDEMLRPYFPLPQVLNGLFTIIKKLFSVDFVAIENTDTWHKDVQVFALKNSRKKIMGYCYFDLFARPHKREGAWMDECLSRRKITTKNIQNSIAFITCNFTPSTDPNKVLLNHDEVITLFHEMGHGLQHLLTEMDYLDVSGMRGVPWDAVEIASQFLENWCWNKKSLSLFAKHISDNTTIPNKRLKNLLKAKNFQSGMRLMRQLNFALFDFLIHQNFNPEQSDFIQQTLDSLRKQYAVVPVPDFNRFQHTFDHIFGGGYAAGYYSYLWAEVLACDVFSKFEEQGIFNKQVGKEFLKTFLAMGGSKDPEELFIEFRGRKPKIEAFLKQNGVE